MKDFAASPGRLRALSVGAKILYTAFALSAVLGLVVSWRLYGVIVADAGPSAYYAGAAVEAKPAEAAPEGGPVVEMPDAAKAPSVIVEQISDRKLLEVTHFHLFSVPVYVLILAHLWLLAKIPSWAQTGGVVAAVVTSALHVAAPWIVRGRPALAPLMGASGAAMLLCLGLMAAVATIDMWLPRTRRRADDAA
ncbi:MAG TPA: hypothetical protein VHB21_25555 [Minicystis sp.]|nr:hypothetical protein [Minicystis sp.]